MPELQGYRLTARSPFRVGQPGIGQESITSFVHSDTLFGALCVAISEVYDPTILDGWLALFQQAQPPLLLSSAFPFYSYNKGKPEAKEEKVIRFFPLPLLPDLDSNEKVRPYRKIKFVSEKIYRQLLDGERPHPAHLIHDRQLIRDHVSWLAATEAHDLPDWETSNLWQTVQNPHVAVDRVTSRSALYYAARIVFAPGGGYHFLIRWLKPDLPVTQDGPTVRQLVESALWYLSDTGLGGDRAAGNGQFSLPTPPDTVTFQDYTDCWSSLSLYHPQPHEWDVLRNAPRTAYELLLRGGWISTPTLTSLQRKPVWMLAEGACLDYPASTTPKELGGLPNVTPTWEAIDPAKRPDYRPAIYRYGRPLLVGMQLPKEAK